MKSYEEMKQELEDSISQLARKRQKADTTLVFHWISDCEVAIRQHLELLEIGYKAGLQEGGKK